MKWNRTRLVALLLGTLIAGSWLSMGCSGSAGLSAPPLDLPAPAAGYVTVGSPDASGSVKVLGSEGAVMPGAGVIAINASNTASTLLKLFESTVTTAHAEDFLCAFCTEQGHVCATADAFGSFEMYIHAEPGENIYVHIFDQDACEMGEGLLLIVPEPPAPPEEVEDEPEPEPEPEPPAPPAAICADTDGKMVDLKVSGDLWVALLEGDADHWSRLIIGGALPLPMTFPLQDFCDAEGLALNAKSDVLRAIVIFGEMQIITSLQILPGEEAVALSPEYAVALEKKPLLISEIPNDLNHLLLGLLQDGAITMARFSVGEAHINKSIVLEIPEGYQALDLVQGAMIGTFKSQGNLAALLLRAQNGALPDALPESFISFIETSNFNGGTLNLLVPLAHQGMALDFAIASETSAVSLVVLNDGLDILPLMHGDEALTMQHSLVGTTGPNIIVEPEMLRRIEAPEGILPLAFDIDSGDGVPVAYVLVDDESSDQNLWVIRNLLDEGAMTYEMLEIPSLVDPTLIRVDEMRMLIGDGKDIVEILMSDLFTEEELPLLLP